jgi:hypothetical protein
VRNESRRLVARQRIGFFAAAFWWVGETNHENAARFGFLANLLQEDLRLRILMTLNPFVRHRPASEFSSLNCKSVNPALPSEED